MRKEDIFTMDIFKGMHTWDNAVLISPAQVGSDSSINIEFPAKIIIDYYS
jgi:hypothetical protein